MLCCHCCLYEMNRNLEATTSSVTRPCPSRRRPSCSNRKAKPGVLRERVPLLSTGNTRPPLPERMLENEEKNRTKHHYKNQIKTSFVQKTHPTSSLAQGDEHKRTRLDT